MIKIENTEVVGFDAAIRGMRNPMNSWAKSDSHYGLTGDGFDYDPGYVIGEADHELMMKLARAGSEHSKYRRMIVVYVDVTAPLYWWKEMDTYKVGTVRNSCSTMHKIHEKEFTIEDFSHEHLNAETLNILERVIWSLDVSRDSFLSDKQNKDYWWQMIQLLPSSYNQRATLMLNYEVLAKMYRERKNHKLDEWRVFCKWVESLPYSELITCENEKEKTTAKKVYKIEYRRLYNRATRRAINMSQRSLGKLLGTSATQICWYEIGMSDEIVTRWNHDITNCLSNIVQSTYDMQSTAGKLFAIQVLLYYMEELGNEDLLTQETDEEIQGYIKEMFT